MAETLGSLIDKLSIKSIREFHLRKSIRQNKNIRNVNELKSKLKILARQKKNMLKEIEEFIVLAYKKGTILRDEKLKMYNKPETLGRIGKITTIARGIDALTKKNTELWNLEDEARRQDVRLAYIGKVKRKIDFANQQRNDLIDKIDKLLEKKARSKRKRK